MLGIFSSLSGQFSLHLLMRPQPARAAPWSPQPLDYMTQPAHSRCPAWLVNGSLSLLSESLGDVF